MERTLALIRLAHQGDKEARDTIFKENMGLIYGVAKRFLGRGVEMEDLFQIGSIGLLKAVDHFDTEFEVRFSTYAVPMIMGEIKRFFRDDGMIKVSRSLKELSYKAYVQKESFQNQWGKEPAIEELAGLLEVSVEELVLALEASREVESLQKMVYQSDGKEIMLMDKLMKQENEEEEILNHLLLRQLLENLDEKEKKLLDMRYFRNRTQAEIGRELGISQVQVSRMEKRILEKLREKARLSQ